jgi:hypothetical protein
MKRYSASVILLAGLLALLFWRWEANRAGGPEPAPAAVGQVRSEDAGQPSLPSYPLPAKAASANDGEGTAALSLAPAVIRLLDNGARYPKSADLEHLTPADVSVLAAAYASRHSMTNKDGIAFALAFVGATNAFDLLARSLLEDYRGRRFERSGGELVRLLQLPWFMGMLVERDSRALELLQNGVEPAFWQARFPWQDDRGNDVSRSLAESTIKGLAVSGHPAAWQTVLNLVSNLPPWFSPGDSSMFVLAACYHDRVVTCGKRWVWDNLPGNFDFFYAWRDTDAGRPWREWQDEKRKGWLP